MKISVFGLGYVGVVTAGCLCDQGHMVVGVDVQQAKLDAVNSGLSTILEHELAPLLLAGHAQGRISAHADSSRAINDTDASIVCVGTPSLESGGLDLRFVRKVCGQIAAALHSKCSPHLLIVRSTMLPGSMREIFSTFFEDFVKSGKLQVAYCPEFLREGTAVADFRSPSLSTMGSLDGLPIADAERLMGACEWLTWEGAEMVKYACNYWHALKVSYANEIGRISKHIGIDGLSLMDVVCRDTKLNISSYYMKPGNPFGGSCLPKDVSALAAFAAEQGMVLPVLNAVIPSNRAHAERLKQKVKGIAKDGILIMGIAFKQETDDLRNSPMVSLAESLVSDGCGISIYDPKITETGLFGANKQQISRRLPNLCDLLVNDLEVALKTARVIVAAYPIVPVETIRSWILPDTVVLDVNGWNELKSLPNRYLGFCW